MIKRKTLEKRMERFVLNDVEHYKKDFYVYDKQILDDLAPGEVIFWFTRKHGTNTASSMEVYNLITDYYKNDIRHSMFIKRVRGGFEIVDSKEFFRKHKEA